MSAPLVDRNTGDIIPAADHNDVKDYIEDAQYPINTQYVKVGGTTVINSTRHVIPVRIVNPDAGGIAFYASNGTTQIALLDENGNLKLKGRVSQL